MWYLNFHFPRRRHSGITRHLISTYSIYHWQRLMNGYSGYAPRGHLSMLDAMREFPSEASVALLRERHVDLVIFHRRYLNADEFSRLFAACKNPQWFTEMVSFPLPDVWGSVACRVNAGG